MFPLRPGWKSRHRRQLLQRRRRGIRNRHRRTPRQHQGRESRRNTCTPGRSRPFARALLLPSMGLRLACPRFRAPYRWVKIRARNRRTL
jgi:hypothetical protein